MNKLITGTVLAMTIAAGTAFAQAPATPSPAPSAPAATAVPAAKPAAPVAAPVAATPAPAANTTANTTKAVALEPAVEAKFKGIDKDNSGFVDGTELAAFKTDLPKIDTDKDGKISRAEFAAALKGGVIK